MVRRVQKCSAEILQYQCRHGRCGFFLQRAPEGPVISHNIKKRDYKRKNGASWLEEQGLFFFFFKVVNFWLCWVFVAKHRLSLVAASRGYSLVIVCRFLFAVVFLVADHRFQACGLPWLWLTGLVTLLHVESSQTRDRPHVPCIGRHIPNHWVSREVLWGLLYQCWQTVLGALWLSVAQQCHTEKAEHWGRRWHIDPLLWLKLLTWAGLPSPGQQTSACFSRILLPTGHLQSSVMLTFLGSSKYPSLVQPQNLYPC